MRNRYRLMSTVYDREEESQKVLPEKRIFLSVEGELKKIGYDINYRRYLRKYNEELDEFAVLVDRDAQTHSETNMFDCIRHCRDNG